MKDSRSYLFAIGAAAALAVGLVASQPASATVIDYSLDFYTGSGSPPAGPYGTVELNDHGGPNVEVTLTLSGGEGFANTGAGAALTWDLIGKPLVTITGLNATNFSLSHNGTTTANLDGTGSWFYEIDCIVCGAGGSDPFVGTLDFTIDSVSLSSFTTNGKTGTGYFFASDICTAVTDGRCSGITGDIASDATVLPAPPPPSVPEPASLALFGTALAGLRLVLRRRRGG